MSTGNLEIEANKDTFMVSCNRELGTIQIEGSSYPEDAMAFFEPVFAWVEDYISQEGKALAVKLAINYLNTSSTKCLFDLIDILEEYYENGGDTKIDWYYHQKDKDIHEAGEEFREDVQLPFELIAY